MIILHISPTDIRYDSRILKEIQTLDQKDKYQVLAYGVNDDEGQKYDVKPLRNIRTFELVSKKWKFFPRSVRYFIIFFEAFFRLTFPALRLKPTVIHCHDTLFLPIAVVVKAICKSKLIYDAHELESNKAGQNKVLSKSTLWIEKFAWKYINLLISVSPSIIKWYNDNLGEKSSLLIMNSPILNVDESQKIKSNYLREKFNISKNKKIFLYLGIISKEGRGIKLYLDVFKKQNIDSHIVFIGYGEYVMEIEKNAESYPNIHYHPAVPHHQVVEMSISADVGLCLLEPVSLSDYYCLPNKLFEYAFAGLFVLASDFPDIKELVEKYSLGKCSSLDEGEIFKVIKSIESMEIKPTKKELYPLSWGYQAEQLLCGYEKLVTT